MAAAATPVAADDTETLPLPALANGYGADKSVEKVGYFSSFPSSIKFLVATEFPERFVFYGLKAVLALYLYQHLGLSENTATELVHLFVVVTYTAPLLGGFFSDGVWGSYRTILWLDFFNVAGIWILLLSSVRDAATWLPRTAVVGASSLGIFLVAFSAGGMRPCICAFGADQVEYSVWNLGTRELVQRRFFSLFYFVANSASVVTKLLTPFLRANTSYAVAFTVLGVMALLALSSFWGGRRSYVVRAPEGNVYGSVVRIVCDAWKVRGKEGKEEEAPLLLENSSRGSSSSKTGGHWLDGAKVKHDEGEVEDLKRLLRVIVVLLPTPVYWALGDQQSSKWVFQGSKLNGRVSWLGGLVIQPDQMVALNPTLVLLMIPVADQLIYPGLRKLGVRFSPLARMVAGILLGALAFVVAGLLQLAIDTHKEQELCILWQLPQYVLITAGEVLFSVTGSAFAYSEAPASMKAVAQSAWMLTVAAGNLVTIIMVVIIGERLSVANEFFVFAALAVVALVTLSRLASGFPYHGQG